jgi:hypothetical protein
MLIERRDVRWTSNSLAIVLTLVAACTVAAADDVAPPPNPDLGELKAIRQDVRALRDDVRRLSSLLEKRGSGTKQSSGGFSVPKVDKKAEPDWNLKEIEKALKSQISLEVNDAPLRDVIRRIQQATIIDIVIDEAAFEEVGVKITDPVSINVKDISLRSVLKLVLQPLNLTFMERDEVLVITNEQRKRGELTAVTYPVEDLVSSVKNESATGLAELCKLITSTISPNSWDIAGGSGSVVIFEPSALIIRQSKLVQGEVSDLLNQLRRLKRQQSANEDRSIVTKAYAVADLVVPIPDGPGSRTKVNTSDWLKLVDRITQVEPALWATNGGPSTIQAIEADYALVIRAPERVHQSISDLLRDLRHKLDVQITVAINFMKVTDNEILEKVGIEFDPDPKTRMIRINEQQSKQLIAAIQSGKGESTFAPKITMFNGQIGYVGSEAPLAANVPIPKGSYQIHVRGSVNEDRRRIRLNVALNPESLINDLIKNSYLIEDGAYLLLDMTEGSGTDAKSANGSTGREIPKKRLVRSLVLVQPRIIVQEEEEQLLAPARKD